MRSASLLVAWMALFGALSAPCAVAEDTSCTPGFVERLLTGAGLGKQNTRALLRESLLNQLGPLENDADSDREVVAQINQLVLQLKPLAAKRLTRMLATLPKPVDTAAFPALRKAALRALRFSNENRLAYYLEVYTNQGGVGRWGAAVVDGAYERVQEAADPYSTAFYLDKGHAGVRAPLTGELLSFESLVQSRKSRAQLAKGAEDWVKSNEHALYLFQHLAEFGPARDSVLEYLRLKTEYFKDVGRIRGPPYTAVTYAFEKETRNPVSTLFYKLPRFTDKEWGDLPEEERVSLLKAATGLKEKVFLPASVVAPTALKPNYLGGYSQEFSGIPGTPGYRLVWEFAHRSYEFSREKLLAEMRDISELLGNSKSRKKGSEANSFHVHVVFELPVHYAGFKKFVAWSKQLNDFLYLSGIEEGLHATSLTRIPNFGKRQGFFSKVLRLIFPKLIRSAGLPDSLAEINARSFKFFTAGLRRNIYGEASDPEFTKVGIELRDPTRDLGQWSRLVTGVGRAVENQIWESGNFAAGHEPGLLYLRSGESSDRGRLVALGIDVDVAAKMLSAEPNLLIGLERFETAKYYDYTDGQYSAPDEAMAGQIIKAREGYIENLKGTAREITALQKSGDPASAELIEAAIRMSISEWAGRAKVSRLFAGALPKANASP